MRIFLGRALLNYQLLLRWYALSAICAIYSSPPNTHGIRAMASVHKKMLLKLHNQQWDSQFVREHSLRRNWWLLTIQREPKGAS